MGFIIHIQPDSVLNKRKEFVGTTKDILGREEYFLSRGLNVKLFICPGRADEEAFNMLRNSNLNECDAVVFEFETYAKSLAYLKENCPRVLRVVRAINANLPHFVDCYRGAMRMQSDIPGIETTSAIEHIETALDRFSVDCQCAELADYVLSICDWETEHYWGFLTEKSKVINVPYFVPDRYSSQIQNIRKRNLFVCFMGTGGVMTPLLYDAGKNTVDLVNALPKGIAKDWMFSITGRIGPTDIFDPLGRLIPTGRLPSPLPILAEARVVSILSNLGMGFKTKILEAIQAGCWVLVPRDLFSRLPSVVRPWCAPIDLHSSDGLARALVKCVESAPEGDPNEQLRLEAFANLDRIFGDKNRKDLPINMVPAKSSVRLEAGFAPNPAEDSSAVIPLCFAPIFNEGKSIWSDKLLPVLANKDFGQVPPRIFEYGTGMGGVLRAVSRKHFECGGVDSSSTMLSYCKQHVPDVSRLGIIGEDGICDFPSEWADLAYSYDAIDHLPTMSQLLTAISEIARILKPGGHLKFRFRLTLSISWLPSVFRFPTKRSQIRMESLLRSVALEPLQIEQDDDGPQRRYWITARKRQP